MLSGLCCRECSLCLSLTVQRDTIPFPPWFHKFSPVRCQRVLVRDPRKKLHNSIVTHTRRKELCVFYHLILWCIYVKNNSNSLVTMMGWLAVVHGNILSFARKKLISQMLKFLCLFFFFFCQCLPSINSSLVPLTFYFLICCMFYPRKILENLEKFNSSQRIILDFCCKHSSQEANPLKLNKPLKSQDQRRLPLMWNVVPLLLISFIIRLIFLTSQFCYRSYRMKLSVSSSLCLSL